MANLRSAAMVAIVAVLAFAMLAQARPAEEEGAAMELSKQVGGGLVPELGDIPEAWVGHTSSTVKKNFCGTYTMNGHKYKATCKGIKFCRKNKCTSLLAMILPIIFGFLLICLLVLCLCCFCGCLACAALCGGGDDGTKEVEMEPTAGVQV